MAIPRFPRRQRLRTLMIVVAFFAVGLGTYRVFERGPVYRLIGQLRIGDAQARREAAFRIGLLGPRAKFAIGTLNSALNDPDQGVRSKAMYSLVRLGSRSPRLLPILAEQIEHAPEPHGSPRWPPAIGPFSDAPKGWTLSDGGLDYDDPIDALKLIRPDASIFAPVLGNALKSPAYWVREAALEALSAVSTWADPSSRELAGALLAVLANYRIDPRTRELEAYRQLADRQRAVEALARLDGAAQARAVAQLAGDLRDLGSPRSYEAALLLPRLGGGASTLVSILLDFIRDGDDTRRLIAMILLEPIARPADAPTVLRAITAPGAERRIDLSGRLHWWEVVGRWLGGPGFQRFCQGTRRTETSLIGPGVRVLKAMGTQVERWAIGELIATVRQPGADPRRRCCAIIALGAFGPDSAVAIPPLLNWDVQKPIWSDDVREAVEKIMSRTPGATVAR